jgi:flagellar biosynthesis GTPase FlhF
MNQEPNQNIVNICSIKTIRDGIHYYQIHIGKNINYFKYRIYDDFKVIDCGEITKKSIKDSQKTIISFEYELQKNYFIKIKYSLFNNNNVLYCHKFLFAIRDDELKSPLNTGNSNNNIKINVKKNCILHPTPLGARVKSKEDSDEEESEDCFFEKSKAKNCFFEKSKAKNEEEKESEEEESEESEEEESEESEEEESEESEEEDSEESEDCFFEKSKAKNYEEDKKVNDNLMKYFEDKYKFMNVIEKK